MPEYEFKSVEYIPAEFWNCDAYVGGEFTYELDKKYGTVIIEVQYGEEEIETVFITKPKNKDPEFIKAMLAYWVDHSKIK